MRAEPKTVTPGPNCDKISKDSTNSAMMRKIRQGSSLTNVSFVTSSMVERGWEMYARKNGRAAMSRPTVYNRENHLTAPKAFAAVEAFVARAVSNCHMTTAWAGGGILLEVGYGITQAFYGMLRFDSLMSAMAISISVSIGWPDIDDIRIIGKGELRDGPVYFLLNFFEQAGHRELRLVAVRRVSFPITRNKLHGHPTENVIRDGGSVADFRILGEAG